MNLHDKYVSLQYLQKLVEGNEEGQKYLDRLKGFIDNLQEIEDKKDSTLIYLAQQISNGTFNNFVNTHYNKGVDDIIDDIECEMERNFVNDNDDSYYEPKTKAEYL